MPRPWTETEYLASHPDLMAAYGPDPAAAFWHWQVFGQAEGRAAGFDGLDYIAGHADLRAAFGVNPWAGALHYVQHGRFEGRADAFDGGQYLANYADLQAAFGSDTTAAAQHFIVFGAREGRTDDAPEPVAPPVVEPPPEPPPRTTPPPGIVVDDATSGQTMTGTAGADTFLFGDPFQNTGLFEIHGGEFITNFQPGIDKLDFSRSIAEFIWLGPDPFTGRDTWPPNADLSSGAPRELTEMRYWHDANNNTVIGLDGGEIRFDLKRGGVPQDGRVDAVITLAGVHVLTAGDVVL